jgi:hypothetical protein
MAVLKDGTSRIPASMLSGLTRRSADRDVTPDLRNNCPVCGNPYQPGEGVLALACLPFATGAGPPAPAAGERDQSGQIILGHHRCVLPRLLTLIASFGPAGRFVTAFQDFCAWESSFPEGYHDEP